MDMGLSIGKVQDWHAYLYCGGKSCVCDTCSSCAAPFPGAGRVRSHVQKLHLVLGAGHSKVLFIQLHAVPSFPGCNWQAFFRITLSPVGVVVIKGTVMCYNTVCCVLFGGRGENRWGSGSFEEEEWLCQLSWMSCSATVNPCEWKQVLCDAVPRSGIWAPFEEWKLQSCGLELLRRKHLLKKLKQSFPYCVIHVIFSFWWPEKDSGRVKTPLYELFHNSGV